MCISFALSAHTFHTHFTHTGSTHTKSHVTGHLEETETVVCETCLQDQMLGSTETVRCECRAVRETEYCVTVSVGQ